MDIFEAIESQDMKRLKKLLRKRKSCANKKRHNNDTPLHVAVEQGNNEAILMLIEYGAQVNTSNGSPLNSACQYGQLEAAHLLLEHGADPNTGCNIGNTPLHTACKHGNVNIIEVLMKYDIDLNARNVDGWTPLHKASFNGKINVVRVLLNEGADERIVTNCGKTAFDFAVGTQNYEIAELIRRYKGGMKIIQDGSVRSRTKSGLKNFIQYRKQQISELFTSNQKSADSHNNEAPEGFHIKEVSSPTTQNPEKWKEIKQNMVNFQKNCQKNAQNLSQDIQKRLKEKPKKTDEDNVNKDKEHECPICFDIPLPPVQIYQCMNGHLFCSNCKDMPNMDKCPQCAVDIESVAFRNRYAEENIKKLYKNEINNEK